ncbi:unnamed protein product [Cuscuta epithymum]|uniref:Uncharacterized protein n=1 Tax=Cuscuta epithymum TaxID=186058 RepID=A0AAV0FD51_9ASTE|nr:unnamed protein product [Cuscuta epithymum]
MALTPFSGQIKGRNKERNGQQHMKEGGKGLSYQFTPAIIKRQVALGRKEAALSSKNGRIHTSNHSAWESILDRQQLKKLVGSSSGSK